jgi:hypothetical protein
MGGELIIGGWYYHNNLILTAEFAELVLIARVDR